MLFIPRGLITLPDATSSVASMYSDINADMEIEDIVFSFGTRLSAGEFTAEGLEPITGLIRQIPNEFWRLPLAHAALTSRHLHPIMFEKGGQSEYVVPMIRYEEVKNQFDHQIGQFSLLDNNLFDFDEKNWNLQPPNAVNTIAENKPKHKGGRPQKYNWDQFWFEASLYIAKMSLPTNGDLTDFHSHMLAWMTEAWLEQPDERTFEREFQKFGTQWDKRRRKV